MSCNPQSNSQSPIHATLSTMAQPQSSETHAALRASSTALGWKRAADLPASLRVTQGSFKTPATGVVLTYSSVFPPVDTPLRGVVLFLHGINEHSQRYFHLFQALTEMGFGALSYDLRSHGNSHMDVPGLRAHFDSLQALIDDTNAFLTFAKQEIYPKMRVPETVPLVVMGFSLGGLLAIQTVLSQKHDIAGIMSLGPCVGGEMTLVLTLLAWAGGFLSAWFPTARIVPGVPQEYVCRDPLVMAEQAADPLITQEQMTSRAGQEILLSMASLQANMDIEDKESAFCKIPILMMHGSNDKVTSLPDAKKFYGRIANADKQFEVVNGAFHVLLEDFERTHVLRVVREWLHLRFPVVQDNC